MKNNKIKENIQQLTEIMQSSEESMVVGIRRCINEKNIKLNDLVIVEWFPDDMDFEFGILVTNDCEVYQFGYTYSEKTKDEGSFSEWENITKNWKDTPHSSSIAVAVKQNEKST